MAGTGMPAGIIISGLEGLYEPGRSAGQLRGYAGFGLLGLSLGPSIVGAFGETKDVALWPELMYLSEFSPKRPLILLQLYGRGDFFVMREEFGDQAVFGVRLAFGV